MTPRLPVVSGATVVQVLERLGFRRVGQRGSHVKLRRQYEGTVLTAIVPLHAELAPGTFQSILRQAAINLEEFTDALDKA